MIISSMVASERSILGPDQIVASPYMDVKRYVSDNVQKVRLVDILVPSL